MVILAQDGRSSLTILRVAGRSRTGPQRV